MKRILFATVTLLALSPAAFAQSAAPAAPGVVTVAPATQAVAVAVPTVMFTTIPTGEDLSSNLVGLDIYNGAKEKIGTVKDIAMSGGRVTPSAITITYGATDKAWHATMQTDAAALKAAPEYKYAS